jgi:hypothetical protein
MALAVALEPAPWRAETALASCHGFQPQRPETKQQFVAQYCPWDAGGASRRWPKIVRSPEEGCVASLDPAQGATLCVHARTR